MKVLLARVAAGNSPAHAVLLTLVSQGFVVLLNVATGVITARLLGPDGRGVFTAATIWPQFLAGFAALGLPAAIVYHMRAHPDARREIAGAAYLLTAFTCLAATAVGLAVASPIMADTEPGTVELAQFCILWTWSYIFMTSLRQIAVANGGFRVFAASSHVPPLIYLLALLAVWSSSGLTPRSAALCLLLSGVPSLIWTFSAVQGMVRPRLRGCWTWMRRMLGYAARFAPSDLSGNLVSYGDRLVLIPFIPAAELGIYVVAYSLSRLVFVLQTAVTAVLFPAMAGRAPAEAGALHDLAFRLVLYACAGGVAATYLLASPTLALIYGPDFVAAVVPLRILVIEAALGCLAHVTIQLFLSLERPGFASVVQTSSLAVAAVSLLVLVPRHGADGAAVALALTAVFRLALLLGGMRVLLGMGLPGLLPTAGDVRYIRAKFS